MSCPCYQSTWNGGNIIINKFTKQRESKEQLAGRFQLVAGDLPAFCILLMASNKRSEEMYLALEYLEGRPTIAMFLASLSRLADICFICLWGVAEASS